MLFRSGGGGVVGCATDRSANKKLMAATMINGRRYLLIEVTNIEPINVIGAKKRSKSGIALKSDSGILY